METIKTEAMIDRFGDQETVVILAEEIGKEFVIKKEELPEGAVRGDYLLIEIENDEIQSIELNPKKTIEQKSTIQSKLEQLRQGKTKSQFKRR